MVTIIPMNGKYQRFKDAGYKEPKYMLPVGNEFLLDKILRQVGGISLETILLAREDDFLRVREVFKDDESSVLSIARDTSGPLETVLSAQRMILPMTDFLIADCDSFFRDTIELDSAVEQMRKSAAAGGVTIQKSEDPAVTYVKQQRGEAREFREKEPFTEWSATGPYWFRRWDTFLRYAKTAHEDGHTSIASIYNYMIRDGFMVLCVPVKSFTHLGTPEAYEAYTGKK